MRLEEVAELIKPNEFDKKAKEMKLPNVYKEKDVGSKTKVTAQTAVMKSTGTGKVYRRSTIYQKEV